MKVCMHGVEIGPSKENVIAGGVPNSVIRISRALNNIGIKPIIVTNDRKYRESGEITNRFTLIGVAFHFILIKYKYASIRYILTYLFNITQKIKLISKDEKLDVIHGHSGHFGMTLITSLISQWTGIPAIQTIYCPIKPKKINFFYKYFIYNIKKIIVISENVKKSLNEIGIPSNKMIVIPPFVDFSIFRSNADREKIRNSLGINNEFVILYLGNLTKNKGIDIVINALSMIKQKYSDVKLITGIELTHSGDDKRQKEILNKITTYKLNQNIIDLGLIKNVENVIGAADVVVAPFQDTYSVADYPLVVLESMAIGTPVITSAVGGIPEIIKNEENGILIDPEDPIVLCNEIIKLIENPEKRKKIGESASHFIKEKLSEQNIVENTKKIYEELLHASKSN